MDQWSAAGKRVLITGATSGIGLAAARRLAALGAEVAVVARSEAKAMAATGGWSGRRGQPAVVDVLRADFSALASVRELAAEALQRYPRIDVLVNNAGAIFGRREITPDGFEMTWQVNHLAPFLLTNLLLDRLRGSAPARIITTSSDAHRGASIPFADLAAERSYPAFGFGRYGETKLANILFTRELARRLRGSRVTANCFHPGFVASGFNRNNGAWMRLGMALSRPFARSVEEGADTLVWLADSPEVSGTSGEYFVDRKVATPTPAAQDDAAAARLWAVSEEQLAAFAQPL